MKCLVELYKVTEDWTYMKFIHRIDSQQNKFDVRI